MTKPLLAVLLLAQMMQALLDIVLLQMTEPAFSCSVRMRKLLLAILVLAVMT